MDVLFTLDRSGRIVHANDGLLGWLHRPLEAVVGQTLDALELQAEHGALLGLHVGRVLANAAASEVSLVRSSADGEACYDGSLLPIMGADAQVAGVSGLLRDGTQRRQAEDAMRRSERYLRAVFTGTHEYFGVMAPDGTLLEANRASLGFAPALLANAIGQKFWDTAWFTSTPGMPERIREAVQAAAAGHAVRQEVVLVHPSGDQMDFDFSLHPVCDDAGHVVLIVPEGRDISERKRVEARQRELEAQLQQAQRLESIGTLAGGIAHDFNNILGAILGNTTLALQDLGPQHPTAARLEQIARSGARARLLVQQILAFSRRDAQQASVQALRPRIIEALAMLRAMLPAGIRVDSELADRPLHVWANATQIEQVLLNLGTNAWQAMPDGGRILVGLGLVTLDAAGAEALPPLKPGRHAHLWMRDDGRGMDAATASRVFEPFFTTKPVGHGSGLGLSVVHGIVAALGGAITVTSAPGSGTQMDLRLPLVDAAAANPDGRAGLQHHRASPPGAGQHVVCIDDDEVVLLMTQALLQRAGYRVSAYGDGAAALRDLEADRRDVALVVTDYNMPGLSGLDVASRLSARHPDVPVLVMSGYIDAELRARAAALGVRGIVHKENCDRELCPAVGAVLQGAGRGGSAA